MLLGMTLLPTSKTKCWDKQKRSEAQRAAADGNIFVIDEIGTPFDDKLCEVYNETTDQCLLMIIAS